MDRKIATDDVRLEIYDMLRDLQGRLLKGSPAWEFAKPCLLALAEGREYVPGEVRPQRERDLAEEARQWFEAWYRTLGFTDVSAPKPAVANCEFRRREAQGFGLFYVPNPSRAFYEQFMTAVGQGKHWTVADDDRENIVWQDGVASSRGYWLWVETALACPRLRTPWETLTAQVRLLSLLEYALVWHATKERAATMLDTQTWCWFRTRYKFAADRLGALNAVGCEGRVVVGRCGPGGLGVSFAGGGGRAAEVVG